MVEQHDRGDGEILVTGAASGIGRATARLLRERGYRVIGLDIVAAEDVDVALVADVSDLDSVRAALAQVTALDGVVHAAAIGHIGTVEQVALADLDRLLAVNVRGTVILAQCVLPLLRNGRGRSLVLIASALAMVGAPQRAAYSATKGAVAALGRQMAVDYVGEAIRVNVINPGTVDTPWVQRLLAQAEDPEEALGRLRARQPMGRLGTAEEVAELAAYLLSARSSFMTGSVIAIDGGYTAQ